MTGWYRHHAIGRQELDDEPCFRRGLRGLAFSLMAGFLTCAPAGPQVFGIRGKHLPDWAMFSHASKGVVVVDFFTPDQDGVLREIDRFAALGHKNKASAPKWLRAIHGKRGLRMVVRRLCRKSTQLIEVHADARIASRDGWRRLQRRGKNLCDRRKGRK